MALPAGSWLAVTGAAGALGGYLIELAKVAGLRVVADAAAADEDLVRSLGADVVVRRGDGLADRILAAVPGGVDAVADAAVLNEEVVQAIRDGGGFATFRSWNGDPGRGITLYSVMVADCVLETERLDRLRSLAEDGRLTLRVADVLPAERAAQAHRRLQAGGVRGRLVLRF